jgi:hypothetical protein
MRVDGKSETYRTSGVTDQVQLAHSLCDEFEIRKTGTYGLVSQIRRGHKRMPKPAV